MQPRGLIAAGALALLGGCGAKTGLDALRPRDAGPSVDGSRNDATEAHGPVDARAPDDAAPACRTDDDCDDGLACSVDRCIAGSCAHEYRGDRCDDGQFCNGPERCEPVVGCVSPGRRCDDGTACTVDACDESRDRCTATPEDDLCPLSFRCDGSRGCVARALVHDATNLYEIDLPSGDLGRVGSFPITLNDIALAPDGTFYGASSEVGALVRVDYGSVTYEIVAPVPGSFNALDVAPDGTIYGASGNSVYVFDVTAGAAREVARLPRGGTSSGDLAWVGGRLYATMFVGVFGGMDELVEVDVTTGRGRAIGEVGVTCVWALAPLGETLFGLTCNGELLELDVTTGAGRLLSRRRGQSYWGAASR
ncbi:MAG: hypothetical protein OHK0013_36050 [Sandaracinaceae bacterium]